jgi:hypothetical protein
MPVPRRTKHTIPQSTLPFGFVVETSLGIQFLQKCERDNVTRSDALRGLVQRAVETDELPRYTHQAGIDAVPSGLEVKPGEKTDEPVEPNTAAA